MPRITVSFQHIFVEEKWMNPDMLHRIADLELEDLHLSYRASSYMVLNNFNFFGLYFLICKKKASNLITYKTLHVFLVASPYILV